MNRLAAEASPYLLQHAGNPVDWYPWGEEALRAARERDRPIFLSIGYATCHWCHVMERESFEDPEVAALLNAGFVAIKVDREERPDIDEQYMSVAQMLTGRGGWPLSIVMTPQARPFFAATYIPKHSRHGRPGLMDLLPRLEGIWRERRGEVEASAASIVDLLRRQQEGSPAEGLPGRPVLDLAFRALAEDYDPEHGGFGRTPKFPTAHLLGFLLRYGKSTGQPRALHMVERTLEAMRRGGIFDHVGLGFHRYSTDESWLLPHFEKMLYDQALLALTYLEAFQATGRALYARVARETLAYVLRDLSSPEGGFCCAEDADSEGEEGRFYLWRTKELEQALGPERLGELAARVPLPAEGSYVEEATGRRTGAHVLHLAPGAGALERGAEQDAAGGAEKSAAEEAADDEASLLPEEVRQRLFQARQARPRPLRDDKVLTGWNGLAVAALARAGAVLGERAWTDAAQRAADFLLEGSDGGALRHDARRGRPGRPAFAEDYAYFVWGLLELYEATFELRYLREAFRLTDELLDLFWEGQPGGGAALYLSPRDAQTVLVRPRADHDGALPSATSVAVLNLLRLARIRQSRDYEDKAQGLLRSLAPLAERHPRAFGFLLWGVDFLLAPSCEVVIAGDPARADTQALAAAARREFLPGRTLLLRPTDEAQAAGLAALAPFTAGQRSPPGQATAYVCRDYACRLPTRDVDTMLAQMRGSAATALERGGGD